MPSPLPAVSSPGSAFSALVLALALVLQAGAVPQADISSNPAGISVPLRKRAPVTRTVEQWGIWAKNHRESLEAKYGNPNHEQKARRATGTNLLTNQNGDSSYFGSIAVGSPPQAFNVILDTGSSDLWLADSACTTGCQGVPTFNPSSSSSFTNESTPFAITYGSGEAAGALGSDVVQMAGFSVQNQIFAVCDAVSEGLLNAPVSGLLGLAFQSIASSKAMPMWQTLVTNNAWDEPLMAFELTRFLNATNVQTEEYGGSFTMGFTNSSLYTGDIDYVNMPAQSPTYWILQLNELTVQGNSITLPQGQGAFAAIDTGTTLIGGPSQYIAEIFAQIPGSQAGSGNFQNYYTYPCDTTVNVTLSFGGRKWSVSPADFRLTRLTRSTCLGAFFELATGSSAPPWIVGDTFLKNVYSVFRYSPLSIGFAELSSTALSYDGSNMPVPTPTIGSVATVSATGTARRSGNSAARMGTMGSVGNLIAALGAVHFLSALLSSVWTWQ